MRELNVLGKVYDDSTPPFLIAEIGHNHQGSLETALQLIDAAAASGASAAKFQKRSNRDLFTDAAFDAPYESENAYAPTYGGHREALEFGMTEYLALKERARDRGIAFFATAFDIPSAEFLAEVGVDAVKIASGDLKSHFLIDHVTKLGLPVIISTGGGELKDIEAAHAVAIQNTGNIAFLQCTAGYPPAYEELNLSVITELRRIFPETVIGYSGHDSGIAMSTLAYGLGARVIEKHFTLDRTMKGTDHAFSLEPVGMRKLSRDLHRASLALGDGEKRTYDSELAPLRKMGKSIVASRDLQAGEQISIEDIDFRSPGGGLPPSEINSVLGRQLKSAVVKHQNISNENIA